MEPLTQQYRAYRATGRHLFVLGVGVLILIGVGAYGGGVIARTYLQTHDVPLVAGAALVVASPVGISVMFAGAAKLLCSVAKVLEARNRNPAMPLFGPASRTRRGPRR